MGMGMNGMANGNEWNGPRAVRKNLMPPTSPIMCRAHLAHSCTERIREEARQEYAQGFERIRQCWEERGAAHQ